MLSILMVGECKADKSGVVLVGRFYCLLARL
jgi:hypothetical protein